MVPLSGNLVSALYAYGMAKKAPIKSGAQRLREMHQREPTQVTTHFKEAQQRNFFRNWRKYRKMTLEVAAELSGMSAGNISAMERGAQNYTQGGLEALAKAYDCLPGQLLMVDPINSDIWSIWELAKTGLPQKEPPVKPK
jgi:hypothetical protein